MNSAALSKLPFRETPLFNSASLSIYIAGTAVFVCAVLGYYLHPLFFIPSAVLLLPLLYINKKITLYFYVLSFAYAIPIFIYRGELRIDDLFFGVLASIWLMDRALNPSGNSVKTFLKKPLLICLAVCGLSVFSAYLQFGAFWGFRSAYFYVRMVEYVLVYFVVSDMIRDDRMRFSIIRLVWIGTLFVCAYGLYQSFFLGEVRITSSLSESHAHIGVVLILSFFLIAGYVPVTKNLLERICLVLTFPLIAYVLFLSASRSAISSIKSRRP